MQAIYKKIAFCILESKQALNRAAVVNGIAKFFFPYAEVMIATTEAFIRVLSWQNKSSFYAFEPIPLIHSPPTFVLERFHLSPSNLLYQ